MPRLKSKTRTMAQKIADWLSRDDEIADTTVERDGSISVALWDGTMFTVTVATTGGPDV